MPDQNEWWNAITHSAASSQTQGSKIFIRILREMTVAARLGGGDVDQNHRLRAAIAEAKAHNVPRDNIVRAIARGTGELESEVLEELIYEGHGPGGVAIIVETLTDNSNRTTPEIRHIFQKHGGELAVPRLSAVSVREDGLLRH